VRFITKSGVSEEKQARERARRERWFGGCVKGEGYEQVRGESKNISYQAVVSFRTFFERREPATESIKLSYGKACGTEDRTRSRGRRVSKGNIHTDRKENERRGEGNGMNGKQCGHDFGGRIRTHTIFFHSAIDFCNQGK